MSDYMGGGVGETFIPQGTILMDAPCRKCGYNLRGLQHNGRCPECGTPAGVSVCGDLLRFSHPRWLRQVAEGLNLILWGVLITFIVGVLSAMAFRGEPAIAQFLAMVGSAVGAWGTWQMTTPDPSGVGETEGVNARKLVRAAVVAGLAASLVRFLATVGGVSLGGVVGVAVVTMVCGVVGIIGEFAKLQYIGRLAERIPDGALCSRANMLKWGLAVCYGAILVIGVAAAIGMATIVAGAGRGGAGGAGGPGVGIAVIGCMALPVGLALLVMAIMVLVLIYRMGKAVHAQVPLAMEIWNRAAAVAAPLNPGPAKEPSAADMRPRF